MRDYVAETLVDAMRAMLADVARRGRSPTEWELGRFEHALLIRFLDHPALVAAGRSAPTQGWTPMTFMGAPVTRRSDDANAVTLYSRAT